MNLELPQRAKSLAIANAHVVQERNTNVVTAAFKVKVARYITNVDQRLQSELPLHVTGHQISQ